MAVDRLRALVRDVADFPRPGVLFKDITPLLADPAGFEAAVEAVVAPYADDGIDLVVGIEARGFIVGAPAARALGAGFVPMRKAGKLPGETASRAYGLEYGEDVVEVHADALGTGRRVLVVDDVLATGGTAAATAALLEGTGADVVGFSFLLELAFLDGRARLDGHRVESVLVEGGGEA